MSEGEGIMLMGIAMLVRSILEEPSAAGRQGAFGYRDMFTGEQRHCRSPAARKVTVPPRGHITGDRFHRYEHSLSERKCTTTDPLLSVADNPPHLFASLCAPPPIDRQASCEWVPDASGAGIATAADCDCDCDYD